jgi:hypothetical protein
MLLKFFLDRKSKPRNFYILAAVTMPIAIATAVLSWIAGGTIANILTWIARGSINSVIALIMLIGPISWSFFLIGVARTLSRVEKNKIHRLPQRTPLRRGVAIFFNILFLFVFLFSVVMLVILLVHGNPLYVVLFGVDFTIYTGGCFFFAPLDDYIFYSRSLWRRF